MYLDKDLLRNVVGIVVINNHFAYVAVYTLLVFPYKQVKAIVPGIRVTYFL